jgi:hypothetical protein
MNSLLIDEWLVEDHGGLSQNPQREAFETFARKFNEGA